MIHILQRAKVHALAAVAVPGAGLAVAANEPSLQPATPQDVLVVLGGFIVVVAGALALAFVRWLNKVEHNVPRDPDRLSDAVRHVHREVEGLRSDVRGIDRRVARIEGSLVGLTVVEEKEHRG